MLLYRVTSYLSNCCVEHMSAWCAVRVSHSLTLTCSLFPFFSTSHGSTDQLELGWQCPGCQNPSTTIPSVYKCFCGKVTNPERKRDSSREEERLIDTSQLWRAVWKKAGNLGRVFVPSLLSVVVSSGTMSTMPCDGSSELLLWKNKVNNTSCGCVQSFAVCCLKV